MHPTRRFHDRTGLAVREIEPVVAVIGVRLQDVSMAPRFSSKVAPQNSPVWRVWVVSRVGDRRLRSLAAGHDGSGSAEWDLRRWA